MAHEIHENHGKAVLVFPVNLEKLNIDSAISTSSFVTTLIDILSVNTYFIITHRLLLM